MFNLQSRNRKAQPSLNVFSRNVVYGINCHCEACYVVSKLKQFHFQHKNWHGDDQNLQVLLALSYSAFR